MYVIYSSVAAVQPDGGVKENQPLAWVFVVEGVEDRARGWR